MKPLALLAVMGTAAGLDLPFGIGTETDKTQHCVGGVLIGTAGYGLASTFAPDAPPWVHATTAIGMVLAAGASKEWLLDRNGRGTVDTRDFYATAVGALVVLPIAGLELSLTVAEDTRAIELAFRF